MARAGDLASSSLGMGVGVGLIALFLGMRLWYERRGRGMAAIEAEGGFFRMQDLRRGLGIGVMTALALTTAFGGRVSPRLGGKANLAFVVVWLAVVVLVIVLLVLALVDWTATLRFARRARKRMIRERLEILRETLTPDPNQARDGDPPRSTPT